MKKYVNYKHLAQNLAQSKIGVNFIIMLTFILILFGYSSYKLLAQSSSTSYLDNFTFDEIPEVKLPEIESYVLSNGLRIYLCIDRTVPLIKGTVRINGGGYLESEDQVGLAEACGRLLRSGGTASYPSDVLDDIIEDLGAIYECSLEPTYGEVNFSILNTFTDKAIELLAEILQRPAFEETKIQQVIMQMKTEVSRRNDYPSMIAEREYNKLIYGVNTPYARHPEYKTLKNITRNSLLDFHKKLFQPKNLQIAIYGDININQVKELIAKYFEGWKNNEFELPPFPEVEYKFTPKVAVVDRPKDNQSNVILGHIGGRLTDPYHPARIILNNILGLGFTSRLFREVRQKQGLAYSVYGYVSAQMAYPGKFICSVATKPESTIKAIKSILEQIHKIQSELVDEKELKVAKDKYLNSFVFYFENLDSVIQRTLFYDFFKLPKDFLFQERENVKKVTAKDVLDCAKKIINYDAIRVLIVGPVAKLDGTLDDLKIKPIEKLDITIPPEN